MTDQTKAEQDLKALKGAAEKYTRFQPREGSRDRHQAYWELVGLLKRLS